MPSVCVPLNVLKVHVFRKLGQGFIRGFRVYWEGLLVWSGVGCMCSVLAALVGACVCWLLYICVFVS